MVIRSHIASEVPFELAGFGKQRRFQQQLTQALDQGTLDSFKEAFAWAPQLRADLLQYVQKTMNVSQKDFLGGLTNGRYNLKDVWFKFLSANESKYSKMSGLFKQSSMATDTRADNNISIALYRIYESSGFQQALKNTVNILNSWASFLEKNAQKIGEAFSGLSGIMMDLAENTLKTWGDALKNLSAEDIKDAFDAIRQGAKDFALVFEFLAEKIRQYFPDFAASTGSDARGRYYIQQEKAYLNQGYSGQEAGRLAEGEMRRKFHLGFEVPTFNENLVKQWNVKPQSVASNFAGTLSLNVDAQVNHKGFSDLVDFKINDNNIKTINMVAGG